MRHPVEDSLPVIAAKAPKTQFKTNSTLIFPPKKMYCPAKPIIPPPNEQHMVATVRGRTINDIIFFTHAAVTVCMQHFFFDFCWTADRIWPLQFSIFVSIFCSFWSWYAHILILLLQEFRDPTMAMDWLIVGSNPGQAMFFFLIFLSQRKKISKNMMKEGSNSVSCPAKANQL